LLAKGNWSPGVDQKKHIQPENQQAKKLQKIMNRQDDICRDGLNKLKQQLAGSCADLSLNQTISPKNHRSRATLNNLQSTDKQHKTFMVTSARETEGQEIREQLSRIT
jgi:hypothetical protein